MPIKNRRINVEVLPVMRFAPDDATLIADSTGDSAIAPGIGPKPQADPQNGRECTLARTWTLFDILPILPIGSWPAYCPFFVLN
jgi:hypothetical protein